jgi:hypothetical protein
VSHFDSVVALSLIHCQTRKGVPEIYPLLSVVERPFARAQIAGSPKPHDVAPFD